MSLLLTIVIRNIRNKNNEHRCLVMLLRKDEAIIFSRHHNYDYHTMHGQRLLVGRCLDKNYC